MPSSSFLLREWFHLLFLRAFSLRLAGRAYAVKGGICLRFFHGSPRLSEDMDLDASPNIRPDTLGKGVDSVLAGQAFRSQLATRGISGLRATRPKQTGTTQRWKIALETTSGSIGTKLEFSRRAESIDAVHGAPLPEILLVHGGTPFAASFYSAQEMARQKTLALAAPGRNAVRDLFDLHNLFNFRGVSAQALKGLAADVPGKAAQKAAAYSFDDFLGQVLPYLTAEMTDAYKSSEAFAELRDHVVRVLAEAV